jgi:hydroxyacylglutathione hydrolase
MERIVELNRGPFLGRPPAVPQVEDAAGAPVLDVRPFEVFAAGHLPGAVNVPVSGHAFATKAGFVVSKDAGPVVHASSPDEGERAIRGLRSVAFLELGGLLLDPAAGATTTLAALDVAETEALLADSAAELIDVREEDEHLESPLPGSRHIPYRLVAQQAATLPRDGVLVTVCESGVRAAVAASVLAALGLDARPLLHGGVRELLVGDPVDEKSRSRHEDVPHA